MSRELNDISAQLRECIVFLTNLGEDVAIFETIKSEKALGRLKRDLLIFKKEKFPQLELLVEDHKKQIKKNKHEHKTSKVSGKLPPWNGVGPQSTREELF